MPQFQVLEPAPSFGGELGKALGSGLGAGLSQGIGSRLTQMLENKKNLSQGTAIATAIGKPELGPLFGQVGIEGAKFLVENVGAENLAETMRRIAQIPDQSKSITPTEPAMGLSPLAAEGAMQDAQGGLSPRAPTQDIGAMIARAPPKQQPALIKAKQAQETLDLKKIEMEEKRAEPFMEQVRGLQNTLSELTTSIELAEDAVKGGELEGFNKDYWAQKLGYPQLVSAKGKQLLVATKNFMTQGKDIFGARLTNYDVSLLEQMFARIGESRWAQLAAIETQKLRRDINQEKVSVANEVRREKGYTPGNIDLLVEDRMKGFEENRRDAFKAKLEMFSSLDGQKTDFRYVKKTLPPDKIMVLKNGKPYGLADKSEAAKLKKPEFTFIQ